MLKKYIGRHTQTKLSTHYSMSRFETTLLALDTQSLDNFRIFNIINQTNNKQIIYVKIMFKNT